MSLVALGTGEPEYEEFFLQMASENPGRIAVRIGFDNALAHRIEAGADMFLMPSRYEPCGLNQMYSLRYGTVPVVRATGGLDDTIEEDTGFKFAEYSGTALLDAVRSADQAFAEPGCLARHDAARHGARLLVEGFRRPVFGALPAVGCRGGCESFGRKDILIA